MNTNEDSAAIALAAEVKSFVVDQVIPLESQGDPRAHGPCEELVLELRERARRAQLLGIHLPKALGGAGLDHVGCAKILRAAGYSPLGPVALNCMAPDEGNMFLLSQVARADQREHFLLPLARGDVRSAFLMTEPAEHGGAGSDPAMMQTTAHLDGGEWVLRGRKAFITGAVGAAFGIVMAKTQGGATMFLMDMRTPGVVIERILDTIDRSMPGGHAIIRLEDVRVPSSSVLGEVDKGFEYAQIRLAPARLTHCMRWWGTAERAHDVATAYACRRHAFGKPLIDHEGVGFMLADNLIDLKQAELLIDWCASELDRGARATAQSSLTKVAVSEALFRIADRSVQVMGGTGVTSDTIVEQAFREIRAFRIYDGPSEVHRWSLAKKLKHEHLNEHASRPPEWPSPVSAAVRDSVSVSSC